MNSNLLNSIGLGRIDIGLILLALLSISIILLILIIITFAQIGKLKKKYLKFMLGKDGANLEKDIMTLYEDHKYMKLSIDRNRECISESRACEIRCFYRNGRKIKFCFGIVR